MKTYGMRLPKFAEYGPQGASGGLTRIRFRSDPQAEGSWQAELSVNLDAPRPTPLLDSLTIRFETHPFLLLLGAEWRLLPLSDGALLCLQTGQGLSLFHLSAANSSALRFQLQSIEWLRIASGPKVSRPVLDNINAHVPSSLPVLACPRSDAWRLNNPMIFSGFIDVGWNLPIPRAPGRFRLQELEGDLSLHWSTAEIHTTTAPSTIELEPELQHAFDAYESGLSSATASLLSAASMSDATGGWLAMNVAHAAAKRNDNNTLRVLRVAHQRALDRGRQELCSIASLITCNAALGDTERALSLVPLLESRIALQLKTPHTAGWTGAHLRSILLRTTDDAPSENSVSRRTPSAGISALNGSVLRESLDNLSPEDAELLSPVEHARLQHRTQKPSKDVPIARREPNFALARQAFAADDDESAWELVLRAVEEDELVENDQTGHMVLRLAARFNDNIDDTIRALQSIRYGRIQSELVARAAERLADAQIKKHRLEDALETLQHALRHVPNSILLLRAYARVLAELQRPEAVEAWKNVLEHPELEGFEAHAYRKELTQVLLQSDNNSAQIDELRALHQADPASVELTHQLVALLKDHAALDEAVMVRSRHAASLAGLRGYPSIAKLVQAANNQEIRSLNGAIAAAAAIRLAATIAHPATWLHRAILQLAQTFSDPQLSKLAVEAAENMGDDAAADAFRSKTKKHESSARTLVKATDTLGSSRDGAALREPSEDDDDHHTLSHYQVPFTSRDTLVEILLELYPATSDGPAENELQSIREALSQSRPSKERAELLGRRAALLLATGQAKEAAQSWTGALILNPTDLRCLAGLTVARGLNEATESAANSREHFLEELHHHDATAKTGAPEALLRIALLLG